MSFERHPRKVNCPICGKSAPWEGNPSRPFCSDRCKLIDLGQWATEQYRVPDEPAPSADQENPQN